MLKKHPCYVAMLSQKLPLNIKTIPNVMTQKNSHNDSIGLDNRIIRLLMLYITNLKRIKPTC
jgi:hypothetical protein